MEAREVCEKRMAPLLLALLRSPRWALRMNNYYRNKVTQKEISTIATSKLWTISMKYSAHASSVWEDTGAVDGNSECFPIIEKTNDRRPYLSCRRHPPVSPHSDKQRTDAGEDSGLATDRTCKASSLWNVILLIFKEMLMVKGGLKSCQFRNCVSS